MSTEKIPRPIQMNLELPDRPNGMKMLDTLQTANPHTRATNGAVRLDPSHQVLCGDNRDIIPHIPDRSIDLVVTSPPYFQQREYSSPGLGNENGVDEYLDNIIQTLRQTIRVMKPTGNIVYNMGDKIVAGSLRLVPYRFAASTPPPMADRTAGARCTSNATASPSSESRAGA